MSTATVTTDTATNAKTSPMVGMAQLALVAKPDRARAVVGSCIGLGLYHSRAGIAMLGHIVLPNSGGRSGPPGKFADTAIPHMIEQMQSQGAGKPGLVAKIAGGANMFATSGPLQIGQQNATAVLELLKELSIPVAAEHVGGTKGRRITVDSGTGELAIEIVGQPTVVL